MSSAARRAVVIGAGVSGLTAAYTILRDVPGTAVTVIEADRRIGGKIRTGPFAGHPVDEAADAFLARVPEAVDLCRELGLADELVTPAVRRAYLFAHGALRAFPDGLSLGVPTDLDALRRSHVVTPAAVERAAQDLSTTEPPPTRDESVGSLVRRRVGDEVYETLVAPLLSGVYAGDADELSAEVATPQFLSALRETGSLIGGLRAQVSRARAVEAPVFYGLRGGTQRLTDALGAAIEGRGGTVLLGTAVSRVERRRSGLAVGTTNGRAFEADAVVVAVPDFVTAGLVEQAVPDVAAELAAVRYSSVVLIALSVGRDQIDAPLDGTGFLVPEREGLMLTACTWASTKWAHLRDDAVILRASAGRLADERPSGLDDVALVERIVADLATTMKLRGTPAASRVSRWPRALPQFAPGHLERMMSWQTIVADRLPGVALAGAGIGGLGIPACIRCATAAVDSLRRSVLS